MALPIPIILMGANLIAQAAHEESVDRRVQSSHDLRLAELEIQAATQEAELAYNYEISRLNALAEVEKARMAAELEDADRERKIGLLNRIVDVAENFSERKFDLIRDIFQSSFELIRNHQATLLREHERYTDASLSLSGPKADYASARLRELDVELGKIQLAQSQLTEFFTSTVSALRPEIESQNAMKLIGQ